MIITAESIIKPLRPSGTGWEGPVSVPISAYPAEAWFFRPRNLSVISAVEVAVDKDKIDRGPEYHISVCHVLPHGTERCGADEAQWALAQFGLAGSEEDNHVPNGKVRNFWRTVAEPMIGLECECKETETVIREGDYEWRP